MKGIVFTEFLEMVDAKFGMSMTEHIVASANLPSGGVYTSIGTYPHGEIVALVGRLSEATKIDVSDLVRAFGAHLTERFAVLFPQFFSSVPDLYAFLENVDNYIHEEVLKLYPDATLPKITTERGPDDSFVVIYRSERKMADLAEGLIDGAIAHFGGAHRYVREDLPPDGTKQCAKFTLVPRR